MSGVGWRDFMCLGVVGVVCATGIGCGPADEGHGSEGGHVASSVPGDGSGTSAGSEASSSTGSGAGGGICAGAAMGNACEQCEAAHCCSELTACYSDSQCLPFEACVFACGPTVGVPLTPAQTACVGECKKMYPEGTAGAPLALFECVFQGCPACR